MSSKIVYPPDASMPIKDHGSFVFHAPCDADIADHRKHENVYIGLHLPRQNHTHRRHRHKRRRSKDDARLEFVSSTSNKNGNSVQAVTPSARVQFLLEEEDDEHHRAHDMFCEMAELFPSLTDPSSREWKETARWIKFEEDVEEGGERWSKPHVATLSLHSLFELRCALLQGSVLLDMDAANLDQVVGMVLDNMIANNHLESTLRDQVSDTLMYRHRHQNEKRIHHKEEGRIHLPFVRSLADIGKKCSEPKNMTFQDDKGNHKNSPNINSLTLAGNGSSHNSATTHSLQDGTLPEVPSHRNLHFMKKIPPGAEASNILVGEVDFLNHQIVAFVRLSQSTVLGDITEVPVPTRFIFMLLGPFGNQNKLHEIGRSIATLMSDDIFHDVAYHAHNREDLLAGLDEFLDQVTVLPPGEWDPTIRIEPPKSVPSQEGRKTASSLPAQLNGKLVAEEEAETHIDSNLVRTGRIFGGLRDDIARKVPFYFSDFKDAASVQCLASFVFLYFACLTPIITFGGLLGDATGYNMAALESILAGSVCGIVYAMFAGQPLTILGSTGPVLVFESILYHFCDSNGWNYLEMRLWVGLWTGVLLLVMVAFDLSALVRYITRFTEESFAALISLIFIVEAFAKVIRISSKYPVNLDPDTPLDYNCSCALPGTGDIITMARNAFWKENCSDWNGTLIGSGCRTPVYQADIFFFSILLFIFTFSLAYFLKMSRNASFFPTAVRSCLSDFAIPISILCMIAVDVCVGIPTPKLLVPETFAPTNPSRGWLINPVGKNPGWTVIAAIIPALLAVILFFMDQQITAVIINRKENKLRKGCGYHLDLFIVSCLIIVCSFFGLPWFVAATVLSINHVNSLKKESQCSAPGEQPKFLGVREQRVTGICIFLFIGISVMLTSVLKFIPMPVLYGVFLYMGVSSLRGMQLVDRLCIILMPAKYQPDLLYLRHVRTHRVHMFTAIQALCLIVLWVIKSIKSISIAFPIMVLAMCFVRKGLDKIFDQQELKWLDDVMPETHQRAKEDEILQREECQSLIDGSMAIPLSMGLNMEHITIQADVDEVNISDEMSRTALWKSIVDNKPLAGVCIQNEHDAVGHNTGAKSRKAKKPHNVCKKLRDRHNDGNSSAIVELDEPSEQSQKNVSPVKFYIDDHEDEIKAVLIQSPEIVVDPPSDASRVSSMDEDCRV